MNMPDMDTFADPTAILYGIQKCYNMWVIECMQQSQTVCDTVVLLSCMERWVDVILTLGGGPK